MIDVVFISDLHLHPDDHLIQTRFNAFIHWAKTSVKTVYILGDFFHAWVGDDGIDEWSFGIANQIQSLIAEGISVSYMPGNRDFLLGKRFASLAGWQILSEPSLIELGTDKILLVHGDRYCTKDLGHQRFRRITRNTLFSTLFLRLPLKYRQKLVNKVRERSMSNTKSMEEMDVVAESVIEHMLRYKVITLIHGHTHKPGMTPYTHHSQQLKRYVLSDWDDTPQILCYHNTKGFYFTQI